MRILIISCLFILFQANLAAQNKAYTEVLLLMGSRFEITAVSADESKARRAGN